MPLVDHRHIDRMLPRMATACLRAPLQAANSSLLQRARFLVPAERLLVELAFNKQLTHRQIGQILSVPAGTITRRLQRICRRLRDPLIVMLMDEKCPLPADQRELALAHFLHRRSTAELCLIHKLTEREVSRTLDFVRGWSRGISQGRQRAIQ